MDGWIFSPSYLKTMALHGEELMSFKLYKLANSDNIIGNFYEK